MNFSRRNFISKTGKAGLSLALTPFLQTAIGQKIDFDLSKLALPDTEDVTDNEEYWRLIRQQYTISPNIINLNNGGISPQPRVVQEAVEHYNRMSNEIPSYYMWQILEQSREPVKEKLAELGGVEPSEVAINRNATEALVTVIHGLRLNKGDEVVLTKFDYPTMMNAWKQRAHRDGIVLKWLSFDFPIEDTDVMVEKFVSAFTPNTKVVHLTHVINWCGQILPVAEIAAEARKRGIEVLVDGAHSFAQMDFKISGLNCDYFGTSLHKWLCAPFGSGMLYVKKDKISKLYPLTAHEDPESDDMIKFQNLGTRSFAIEAGIGHAVDFHNLIGAERKEKRLQYLKKYWVEQVSSLPAIRIRTSLKKEYGSALTFLEITGKDSGKISKDFFVNHQIHTVAIKHENLNGLRITPNVYTLKSELDKLVKVIKSTVA